MFALDARQVTKHEGLTTDFKSDDPATDPTIVEEARRLSSEIEQTSQATEHSPAAVDEMEGAFGERVKYIATLEAHLIWRNQNWNRHCRTSKAV